MTVNYLKHSTLTSITETVYLYLVPILSPVTDKLLLKRGEIPRKNVSDAMVDLGAT